MAFTKDWEKKLDQLKALGIELLGKKQEKLKAKNHPLVKFAKRYFEQKAEIDKRKNQAADRLKRILNSD